MSAPSTIRPRVNEWITCRIHKRLSHPDSPLSYVTQSTLSMSIHLPFIILT